MKAVRYAAVWLAASSVAVFWVGSAYIARGQQDQTKSDEKDKEKAKPKPPGPGGGKPGGPRRDGGSKAGASIGAVGGLGLVMRSVSGKIVSVSDKELVIEQKQGEKSVAFSFVLSEGIEKSGELQKDAIVTVHYYMSEKGKRIALQIKRTEAKTDNKSS